MDNEMNVDQQWHKQEIDQEHKGNTRICGEKDEVRLTKKSMRDHHCNVCVCVCVLSSILPFFKAPRFALREGWGT